MESQSAPRLVSATARRHGISRSQLGTWLREFRAERAVAQPGPAFVPAVIAPAPMSGVAVSADEEAIVVDLPTGGRVRFAASTPAALAAAVLGALR